jgi:tetratricopeptide (TPR) repeat protein
MAEIYAVQRYALNIVMSTKLHNLLIYCGLLALVSCAGTSDDSAVYVPADGESESPAEQVEETAGTVDTFVRQRILADMLYEARLAYEDNRLMSPAGSNAYDGFRAVLDFDPENAVALQGMHDIVLRYVQLADAALQVRQFDNAEDLLNRAARIDPNEIAIADARLRLEQERQIKMDTFALDGNALAERNLEIMAELGEIGQYIRDREATFMINARTDEEGRWIYQTMRNAVGGYRLRGNIAMDSEPSIQVVIPKS